MARRCRIPLLLRVLLMVFGAATVFMIFNFYHLTTSQQGKGQCVFQLFTIILISLQYHSQPFTSRNRLTPGRKNLIRILR